MSRYIDAEKFKKEMYHEAFETDSDMQKWDSGCWIRYKMFENCIAQQPTADVVEVVHGRWKPYIEDVEIYNTGGFTEKRQTGWICGKCKSKKSITQYYPTDFCPNCGAKMDGKKVE